MSRIVVLGGGFGGMASAARLAKLGHQVSLVEASSRLGGALGTVERDGFSWDSGPTHTMLPAVLRDLFRKSGRALEKEIDLVPVEPLHQHRFEDGTTFDLPGGSRGGQLEAVSSALGPDAGRAWTAYVDQFRDVWALMRRDWLERPWSPEHADKATRALMTSRQTLHKLVNRDLKDWRLRDLALQAVDLEGHDPRNVPAFLGMWSHVEQNFGLWTVAGGMGQLTTALAGRLATRGVTVHTATRATDLRLEAGRPVGVTTDGGDLDADLVVVAIDPRRLPTLARYVDRTMPVIPPVVCHLGVVGEVADLPHEVVLHGDPLLVLRTRGTAPAGAHAWTLLGRGRLSEDIVDSLSRGGIRVRDQVEVRVDRSARELVEDWGGSPDGVLWQGRRTLDRRLGTRTPVEGVFMAGAHTTPGAGLPLVGLSAALVAQVIGPAER